MKTVRFLSVFLLGSAISSGQNVTRPNIILMMADDMGMGDTSAYQDFTGNSDQDQLYTPAMEELARMGVRFTDAHTPSSRCSPTRYGLLTGRYPWRNRLKHWVLFGAQGDPMIEADRPTIATLLRDHGYRTGMVGKWHVGLRYRRSNGQPAAGFQDADLKMPLADTPLDHGFDFCRFTSRSHGTSGPQPGKKNKPNQTVGPGHLDGRTAIGATDNGRQLAAEGETAYVLSELGGRHFDNAMEFLNDHVKNEQTRNEPFFLYYPSNSNHGPHTPDTEVADFPVAGSATTVAGETTTTRNDYIYENDVALAGLLKWLLSTDDPRSPEHRLFDNTLVIFTSDNGAEKNSDIATGPFRSHKGSCYEGGHRVPFIASWPAGKVGGGFPATSGRTSTQLVNLTDIFATFGEILQADLPDNAAGQKGAEDSVSILSALKSDKTISRASFYNDHKEAKQDRAAAVLRLDDPVVDDHQFSGQWKLFFDAQLLRNSRANPVELFDLKTDSKEVSNRISEPELQPLVKHLSAVALHHRTAGGHRLAERTSSKRMTFSWVSDGDRLTSDTDHSVISLAETFRDAESGHQTVETKMADMTVSAVTGKDENAGVSFSVNPRGMGIAGGRVLQVDSGEAFLISFDRTVVVESVAIVAGNGACGGFYTVGDGAPLAIYCVDADNDAQDQSGLLSDIGVLPAGRKLRLDSSPHHGVEPEGKWRLASLTIRLLSDQQ